MTNLSNNFTTIVNGKGYTYKTEEDFNKDMSDGKIDGKVNGENLYDFWDEFGISLDKIFGTTAEVELSDAETTQLANLDYNKNKLNILEGRYSLHENNIKSFQFKSENIQDEIKNIQDQSTETKDKIKEYQDEIKKTQQEISKYMVEEQKKQDKELNDAIKKAEREYNKEKHGPDKDAYVAKQTASLMGKQVEAPTDLNLKISELQNKISSLQAKTEKSNKTIETKRNLANQFSTMSRSERAELENTASEIETTKANIQAGEAVQAKVQEAAAAGEGESTEDPKKKPEEEN